jgi:hypothetical protein
MMNCKICQDNLVAFTVERFNSDNPKSVGLHERDAVATWEIGNYLSICLKTEENQENLCRYGGPQDLQDAH